MTHDHSVLSTLLGTSRSHTLLAQRLTLAAVILPHGAQKLFGWFGGYGFTNTMGFFTETLHVPAPLAFLVILAESAGAAALLLGAGARVAAAGIAAVMVGAVLTTHLQHGFFMNWFGAQAGEGFEYHLLALGLALPLVVRGAGAASVDGWLTKARRSPDQGIATGARA